MMMVKDDAGVLDKTFRRWVEEQAEVGGRAGGGVWLLRKRLT